MTLWTAHMYAPAAWYRTTPCQTKNKINGVHICNEAFLFYRFDSFKVKFAFVINYIFLRHGFGSCHMLCKLLLIGWLLFMFTFFLLVYMKDEKIYNISNDWSEKPFVPENYLSKKKQIFIFVYKATGYCGILRNVFFQEIFKYILNNI